MRQKKQKNRIYEKIIRILPLLLLLLIIVIPFLIAVSLISFDGSFFEGFESGSFSTYGWEASAGTGAWAIATTNPYGGTYHAQAGNTASVERTLSLNISTLRYQNISFKFYYQTANTETGDYIAADWYNGTAWVNVLNVSSQPTYTLFSINLPSQADNNSNFKIRFRCMTNATNERCRVDNVSVTATTLINTKPTQAQPILNSTYNTNLSSENITCYNQSTYDADNDEVKNIFSWRKNNIPFAIVIMPFEGGKDSLNNNDFSGYSNSGKINNALFNKTGGYDGKGAYQFDGSSAFIELVDSPSLNVTENITILAWVKTTTTSPSWQFIIEKGINDSDNYAFALQRNQLFFEYANSNYYFFNTTTANINANVWYFVGVSTNRTNLKFYLNGNEIQSYNLTEPIKPWTGNLWIGRQNKGTSNFYFNGTIDEVMIFDKTLSPQQINAIYKNKSNVIVSEELRIGDKWSCAATPTDIFSVGNTNFSNNLTIRENINPSVKNITPPKNSSYKNGSVINITANVTDNYKLDKVFVNVSWNNGSWVSEMTNISEIYNATFTNTSAEGVYNITIIANDSFGNINNTEKSYFIIYTPETNPPLITLNYPPNNFITNNNYINFNWTTIDDTSEIMMCNITINNAVNISGITAYNNTPVNYSIKNLTDNTYYWNISCSDNLNNSNTSETRTFLIDTAAPYWADASLNQSDVYWNQTIYFNASWLDNNNLAGYIFYINQTGNWENSGYIPFSGQQNISEISFHIDAIAGANVYWYFWANDTAGNFNQTEIKNFSVKPRPTAVTILLNQSIYPQGLEPGLGYDILIPINVTFKDTISNNFISDGDCAVSNDKSSEIIYLNFNSTSKSYEGKIDTSWLYDNVTFNASCSAGINYLNSSNITSANVWAYIYLWDWYNLSYYGGYDKYWLRKNPPEGGLAVLTEEKNLSPGLNGIRTFYFYGPNINGTMARDFEIYNLHTISLNISLNDTRCKPIICSSIINKALESLIEGCGNEHTIPANTPTVIEDNITGNYTVRIDEYIGLKLYLNCSDYVNMSLSVYFNYSGMQPNIFASEAVPMKVSS
ncbi:MAG: LamG domain-containing protein, partial [Candidatus Woesearchaeota archaeon]